MARYRSRKTGRFVSNKNAEKIKRDFEAYSKTVNDKLEYHFATNASKFVGSLGRYSVPVDTGNLHDSIGVGILVDGVIKKWTGAGGLKYLARPKLITSYKMLIGEGEEKKHRNYKMQHWGSFNGLIKKGYGTGKDYLEEIDSKLKRRQTRPEEKGTVTFLCFAAIPYAYPLHKGVGKGAYYKNWFFDVLSGFRKQVNSTIKYGFLSGAGYSKFKYLSKSGDAKSRVTLNIAYTPSLESPIIEL